MQKNNHKNFLVFAILIIVSVGDGYLLNGVEAATWSQATQIEFETNTLSNIDTTTNPGEVTLSGAYSSDANTVLLLHMNESSWNGTDNEVKDFSSYKNYGKRVGNATTTNGKFGIIKKDIKIL